MRKSIDITITKEGRDKGKVFRLTEMSASAAERWAARALNGLARSGIEIPESLGGLDLMAIAAIGFKAFASMSFAEAEPLMADMMVCVRLVPDQSRLDGDGRPLARTLIEDDIEEVATRLQIRKEVFALHVDFSGAVGASISALTAIMKEALASMTTPTSPKLLDQ